MAKVLRVFDFDDSLATTDSHIYIKHKNGTESKLTPGEYATYEYKDGDHADFRDFNTLLKSPKAIKKNVELLRRMLNKPHKKVTILTARALGYPIKKFFKDEFGMDVYVVALASNNPKDKADWIEKHIKKGYKDIAFMDDSAKNIRAVDVLKRKYPDVRLKTVHVTDHMNESEYERFLEEYNEELFKVKLNN